MEMGVALEVVTVWNTPQQSGTESRLMLHLYGGHLIGNPVFRDFLKSNTCLTLPDVSPDLHTDRKAF